MSVDVAETDTRLKRPTELDAEDAQHLADSIATADPAVKPRHLLAEVQARQMRRGVKVGLHRPERVGTRRISSQVQAAALVPPAVVGQREPLAEPEPPSAEDPGFPEPVVLPGEHTTWINPVTLRPAEGMPPPRRAPGAALAAEQETRALKGPARMLASVLRALPRNPWGVR